jgi:dephospho-CoA kinase
VLRYGLYVKTIGLTGGIGSGKTTVARMLHEFGATVIHADAVGHEIYQPNSIGWRRVTEAFGTGILRPDQTVDRKKLGAIVFGDAQALKRLNAIVHPLMADEIRRRIQSHRTAGFTQPIILEAAILIEANWLPLVDEVWLVTASRPTVIERIAAERSLLPQEVETRIRAQLSDAERRRFAQVVIENDGSVDELRERVRAEWIRLTRNEG